MAKRISDTQRQILKAANHDIDKEVGWLYTEAVKNRSLYDNDSKKIKDVFKTQHKVIEERGLAVAKDVVDLLGWEDNKKHKDNRNRYVKLTNLIGISNGLGADEVHEIFMVALKRYLLEDFDHPMDAMMSKKEQRNARKRRKVEKKYGEKKEIKIAPSKSEEEKKIQSRLRKLKREATKENISLEDYMKEHNYGQDGKKIKE